MSRAILPVVLLALVVLAAHGRVLGNDHAGDPRRSLGDAARVGGPLLAEDLSGRSDHLAGPPLGERSYRPLASALFAVERSVFGDGARGYHAISLVLLLALGVALVGWVVDLGLPRAGGIAAAAILLVHPAAIEPAAYVPAQATLAATLAAVLAARAIRRDRGSARVGAAALYGVSLAFEPALFVVPWLGLIGAVPRRGRGAIVLGAVAATWFVARIALFGTDALPIRRGPLDALAVGSSLVPAALAWWFLPHGFPYGEPFDRVVRLSAPDAVFGLGFLTTLAILGVLARRAPTRIALGGFVLGWIALVPGLFVAVPPLFESRLIALWPAAAVGLASVWAWIDRAGEARKTAARVVPLVFVLAAILLWRSRHDAWSDDVSLESRAHAERPEDAATALRRSRALAARGRLVEAWRATKQAVDSRPLDGTLRVGVADLVGEIADRGLAEAELGIASRQLRQLQALGYREALEAFARRAGQLDAEEESLRTYALAREFDVALGLGDLDLAREALTLRVRRSHLDAPDWDAALARAGWPARRDLLRLALRSLEPPPEGVSEEEFLAARVPVLELAGLDPARTAEALLADWAVAMEDVRRAMEADPRGAPDPEVPLLLARVLERLGESERAAALRGRTDGVR